MVSQLERAIIAHRNAIRSIDRAALANVYLAYQDVMERINPQIELLQQALRDKGELTASQVFRLERYQELQRQIAAEMRLLGERTGTITEQAQRQAATLALESAESLAASSATTRAAAAVIASSWVRVPFSAVEDFIGASRSGPLFELLSTFEDVTMRAIVQEITAGLATGTNPRAVADAIRKGTEIGRNRALTIARTEMLRSMRSATLASYNDNRDILSGYIWTATLSDRTCAACLAMDGTFHELNTSMDTHPNCRCTMRPALKDVPMRPVQTGGEWFREQPASTQDAILGKQAGIAYRAGDVDLHHFVRRTESRDWGVSLSQDSLQSALARASAEERRAA